MRDRYGEISRQLAQVEAQQTADDQRSEGRALAVLLEGAVALEYAEALSNRKKSAALGVGIQRAGADRRFVMKC